MQNIKETRENPTISIVIPVYNVEKYLEKCLTSIKNQTYNDFEVILIDDGSTDNSGQICEQWKQKDNRFVVVHQNNSGAGAARNTGLKIAKGKYIGFVDGDDWIDSRMYQILIDALEKNPDCDIAECNIKRTNSHNNIRQIGTDNLTYIKKSKEEIYLDFFRVNGGESNYGINTKLINKQILSGFAFLEGTISEDVMASYEFYTRSKYLVKIPIQLYYYFQNREGVTRKAVSQKDFEYIYAFKRIYEDIKNKYPKMTEYAYMNYIRANFTILSKMKLIGYDKNDKTLKSKYKEMKIIVRSNFIKLMKWNMPLNRKALLIYVCI